VKRLIVLLIVVAGGLAAAAFAVPSNAATVNGTSISRQQFNSDLTAIANSTDYQCFLNAEEAVGTNGASTLSPVDGAGQIVGDGSHPTVTAGFATNYLDTEIDHQLVLQLAATRHVHPTAQDLSMADTGLTNQITGVLQEVAETKYGCGSTTAKQVLDSMPTSFVHRNVVFDATVSMLEEDVAGVGSSTADLQSYYQTHAAQFDKACFTVAEYTSQTAAQAAESAVAGGTPFATVAAEAVGGGPQGCDILYGVAAGLPSGDLETLPVGTVSSPIAQSSDYLLVEITSESPTPFATARTEVESAVQSAGATKASTLIDAAGKKANVTVDPRYGAWNKGQVHSALAPPTIDVLNPSVNGSGT
jgi:hypothetical protein